MPLPESYQKSKVTQRIFSIEAAEDLCESASEYDQLLIVAHFLSVFVWRGVLIDLRGSDE